MGTQLRPHYRVQGGQKRRVSTPNTAPVASQTVMTVTQSLFRPPCRKKGDGSVAAANPKREHQP